LNELLRLLIGLPRRFAMFTHQKHISFANHAEETPPLQLFMS